MSEHVILQSKGFQELREQLTALQSKLASAREVIEHYGEWDGEWDAGDLARKWLEENDQP